MQKLKGPMDTTAQISKTSELIQFLSQFATEHKLALMEQVLSNRTRYITVVLEDLYQSQNASAIVRTCECLGIQDVHVIEQSAKYGTNKKVLKGSQYWVDIVKHKIKHRAEGVSETMDVLRSEGYRVLVTSVDPGSTSIHEIDITQGKVAIVMGNELRGTSTEAVQHADGLVHIPMVGFTESFNVSVSAAICLSAMRNKLTETDLNWQLSEIEKDDLRLKWLRVMVKKSDVLIREYLRGKN